MWTGVRRMWQRDLAVIALGSAAMRLYGPRMAVTLLTAVPLPNTGRPVPPDDESAWRAAMIWAPFVGLGLGAVGAGVLQLFGHLLRAGPLLGSVLVIGGLALLTRGLHLDGLADLADGLGSGRPAAAALDIMKRSDLGPFGAMTLVLILLIQVTALARADLAGRGYAALLVAGLGSRLAFTWACRRGVPAARGAGLGARVAGTVHPLAAAALTAAALGFAAWLGVIFIISLAAGLAAAELLTRLAVRRLGGITGDVLGAAAEIALAVSLLVAALR
jgi:adenosylcobinamide-GDP ribazoletransferase